jgi:hypothetical protein
VLCAYVHTSRPGAPIFASNARFVGADSVYWQRLQLAQCDNVTDAYAHGLCPDDALHVTCKAVCVRVCVSVIVAFRLTTLCVGAVIEPMSGLIFGARKLLQINIEMPANVLLLYPDLQPVRVCSCTRVRCGDDRTHRQWCR